MIVRVYKLSEINDGLGGVSEEKTLIYEGRGRVVQKEHSLQNSPFAYEDRVYDVIIPNELQLDKDSIYEMEVEE